MKLLKVRGISKTLMKQLSKSIVLLSVITMFTAAVQMVFSSTGIKRVLLFVLMNMTVMSQL